jgi:hypothetical protein
MRSDAESVEWRSAMVDGQGKYSFAGVAAGHYLLDLRHPGWTGRIPLAIGNPAGRMPIAAIEPIRMRPLMIELGVAGKGAWIEWTPSSINASTDARGRGGNPGPDRLGIEADSSGRALVQALPPGRYDLTVWRRAEGALAFAGPHGATGFFFREVEVPADDRPGPGRGRCLTIKLELPARTGSFSGTLVIEDLANLLEEQDPHALGQVELVLIGSQARAEWSFPYRDLLEKTLWSFAEPFPEDLRPLGPGAFHAPFLPPGLYSLQLTFAPLSRASWRGRLGLAAAKETRPVREKLAMVQVEPGKEVIWPTVRRPIPPTILKAAETYNRLKYSHQLGLSLPLPTGKE